MELWLNASEVTTRPKAWPKGGGAVNLGPPCAGPLRGQITVKSPGFLDARCAMPKRGAPADTTNHWLCGRPPHSLRELTVMCPGHYGCLHGNGNAGTL